MLSAASLKALAEARLRFIVGARTTRAPGDLEAHFHWEGDAFTDITAEAVSRRGEKGDYYLFYKAYNPTSPWYSGFSYVDLMLEGAAD